MREWRERRSAADPAAVLRATRPQMYVPMSLCNQIQSDNFDDIRPRAEAGRFRHSRPVAGGTIIVVFIQFFVTFN